jgi:sec-independent protein translocase protein TatC
VENLPSFDSPQIKAAVEKFAPFLHEVRRRVVVTVLFFVASTSFGFFFYEKIIGLLLHLMNLQGVNIVFTSPFQFINLAISCGVASGVIITFPLILYQLMSFVKPALQKREYTLVMRLIPFSLILFALGFCFGALVMKWQIDIFLTRSISLGIGNVLDISQLLTTIMLTAALMGVLFEFPIVLLLLMRFGVVKRQFLSKYRFYVYVISFVIAVFLPPDSILADILLSLPLILMFECTLLFDRAWKRKRDARTT